MGAGIENIVVFAMVVMVIELFLGLCVSFKLLSMKLAERRRHNAAFLGGALMASGRLPRRHAESVRLGIDGFFSFWLAWSIVLSAPFVAIGAVLGWIAPPEEIEDELAAEYYAEFVRDWWIAFAAQNPLPALLLVLELPFLAALWLVARSAPQLSGMLVGRIGGAGSPAAAS